ncbi:MAG: acetyl-CoA carboxylase biotin carboxyl carrier protein subunit [Bacteroidia bacterium]|jgi:biotin carboxyl carrier protein|nr:acetyl-CoA carboxylase biotin carboxyl carrier protein subunit [Bacteroidia bacterium]
MQKRHIEVQGASLPSEVIWLSPWEAVYKGVRLFLVRVEGHKVGLRVNSRLVEVSWTLPVHRYQERVTPPVRTSVAAQELRAPMPGLIREVRVAVGTAVTPHTPALVLEAMKMENLLFPPAAGIVEEVCVAPGQAVEKGALLLRLRPADAD